MNQSLILTARKQMGQWPILPKAVIPHAFWCAGMEDGLLISQVR